MAFILSQGSLVAFAEYSDVTGADQRLFEANEGIADANLVEDLTEKATNRILQLIRNTSWWRRYYLIEANAAGRLATQTLSTPDVPLPDGNRIEGRASDWTDLCVYFTFYEYLLPKIADFGQVDSSEVKKIGYYRTKFDELFRELIDDGTWYDFDNSGTVSALEKMPTRQNLVRVR